MDIELTSEQKQVEQDAFAYLKKNVPLEMEEELFTNIEGDGAVVKRVIRQLGNDGWMGMGWPKEYGGQGRTPIEQYIFFDLALGYFRIPIQVISLMMIGPTLMKVGNEEQKKKFLPPILTGDLTFAVGYTEPEAGTDLFSLKTTAVRDGDDYIINGQKTFTSMAHFADYFWLAARTNSETEKQHDGISIFIVDARTPGITVEPLYTMGGFRVNHEFFDNVRVPKESLVGEENKGIQYMFTQLAHERVNLVPHSMSMRALEDVTLWAQATRRNGSSVIKEPWVVNKLAELSVEAEVLRLFNFQVTWLMSQGENPFVQSSISKAFGSEHFVRVMRSCQEILGPYGQLQIGSKRAPVNGWIERLSQMYLTTTFGGGTNEVMRDIISTMGLGMMKSR